MYYASRIEVIVAEERDELREDGFIFSSSFVVNTMVRHMHDTL